MIVVLEQVFPPLKIEKKQNHKYTATADDLTPLLPLKYIVPPLKTKPTSHHNEGIHCY